MATHDMDITRDRAFLNDPSEWPIQVRGGTASVCALKKPSWLRTPDDGHATLLHTYGHYMLVHVPLPVFMTDPEATPEPEITTVEAVLDADWIVD